jgi:hypothetical protein
VKSTAKTAAATGELKLQSFDDTKDWHKKHKKGFLFHL